jgi:uncharacterized protein (TIGR00369 family)
VDSLLEAMPFAQLLGIELVDASAEEVRARIGWSARLCTTGGVLHGGVLMSLADTAGAMCAFLNLPPGGATSTIESKTNFLPRRPRRPCRCGGSAPARGPFDDRRADRRAGRIGPPRRPGHADAGGSPAGLEAGVSASPSVVIS